MRAKRLHGAPAAADPKDATKEERAAAEQLAERTNRKPHNREDQIQTCVVPDSTSSVLT